MTDDTKLILNEIAGIKREVRELQLTLENETNRNIQLIAEGHTNLARKLDDALKIENDKEILMIKVTSLENEVRRLKERIANLAG